MCIDLHKSQKKREIYFTLLLLLTNPEYVSNKYKLFRFFFFAANPPERKIDDGSAFPLFFVPTSTRWKWKSFPSKVRPEWKWIELKHLMWCEVRFHEGERTDDGKLWVFIPPGAFPQPSIINLNNSGLLQHHQHPHVIITHILWGF